MTLQPISRIVVATDFSGEAGVAVKRAARLADELKAELHLVTVVEETLIAALRELIGGDGDKAESPGLTSARTRLAALAQVLHDHYSIRAEAHVTVGVPHTEVVARAAALSGDLLVVGAHGADSYSEMFFGTTASRIVRLSAVPVLAVRNAEVDEYAHVLVGVDFSDRSPDLVQLALTIAPRAYIEVVHAVEIPSEEVFRVAGAAEGAVTAYRARTLKEARERMRALLERRPPDGRLYPVVVQGRPAQVLIERISRLPRAALVVVGRRGRATDQPTLLGTAAKHVVEEATRDVLIGD